jgi:hypothetical protein
MLKNVSPGLARLYAELTEEALQGMNPENLVEITSTASVPI